jgi:4-amino-4-deoxy-L-arabinose transferase-like glycosyltransferase
LAKESLHASPLDAAPGPRRAGRAADLVFYGAVVLLFIYLADRVSTLALCEWDEARNARNAYEMMKGGDWIALKFDGALDHWNLKPPLYMWMMAALFRLFGYSELAVRLPSLLFGMGVAVLTYRFVAHVAGDRFVAAAAAFALPTCRGYYGFHALTSGDVDIGVTFFNLASFMAIYFIFVEGRPRWWLALGASLGLGFMTKSFVGLLPAGLGAIAFLAWSRDWRVVWNRHFALGVAIALAIILPWLLARQLRYPDNYLRLMWATDIVRRSQTTVEEHYGDIWFYWDRYLEHLGKWVFVGCWAALAVVNAWVAAPRLARRDVARAPAFRAGVFAILAVLFYYAAFSASVSKLMWYMIPAYAVLFVLIGIAFAAFAMPYAKPLRYGLLAFLLVLNAFDVAAYNAYRRDASGMVSIDYILTPLKKELWGKKIIVEGDEHLSGYTVAGIYSDLQVARCFPPQGIDAMLKIYPQAEYVLSMDCEHLLKESRLRAVRVIDQKGQPGGKYGLFKIVR